MAGELARALAAAFGSLTAGPLLCSLAVGEMVARGQAGPLILGIITFIILGHSNNAFRKLGSVSRSVDAGSWAVSGLLMLIALWIF